MYYILIYSCASIPFTLALHQRKGNSALHVALLEEDEDTALLLLENDKDTDINTRASYHMNLDILNVSSISSTRMSRSCCVVVVVVVRGGWWWLCYSFS